MSCDKEHATDAILIDLFECCDVHMLRNSVSPICRIFSSPPTAIPCLTFIVSVCMAELKDSVYIICDAVFSFCISSKAVNIMAFKLDIGLE